MLFNFGIVSAKHIRQYDTDTNRQLQRKNKIDNKKYLEFQCDIRFEKLSLVFFRQQLPSNT